MRVNLNMFTTGLAKNIYIILENVGDAKADV